MQQALEQRPAVHTDGRSIAIIGGNCEFCGVKASACHHTEDFIKKGSLQRSEESRKDEDKIHADFPNIPRCINGVCEFCGVNPLVKAEYDEEGNQKNVTCKHAEERRMKAFGFAEIAQPEPSKEPETTTEDEEDSETNEDEEGIKVEESGDPEMDDLMDQDEDEI